MKKLLGLTLVAMFAIALRSYSTSVNPASNVTADSDATALTIIYRDASANFAANDITATDLILSGQQVLQVATTTQLVTLVPLTTGAIITVRFFNAAGVLGNAYGNCVSSGILADQWVYPSSSTTSAARSCK